MIRTIFGLCLMTFLCSMPAWADNPGTGPYDAPAKPKSESKCRPCYELPNGCPKPKVSKQCAAFDAAHPGYLSGIDSQCGLPSGTAMGFAMIESGGSCKTDLRNKYGYTGLFQFDTRSCKRGNLYDLGVQAACMCDYTANTRRSYEKATGGKNPSAGMYYMFHQQGSCGFKLAMGGNARAVDILAGCVKGTKSSPMGYALKAIGGNLPQSLRSIGASNVTAQQFANGWMQRFGDSAKASNASQGSDVCASDGSAPEPGATPETAAAEGAAGGAANPLGAMTSMMNADGSMFSPQMIQSLMASSISQLFPGMLSFNPAYDEGGEDGYDEPTPMPEEPKQETVNVTTNTNGTVTVTVTNTANNTNTYTLSQGQQLWKCGEVYEVVSAAQDATMVARGCSKVAEAVALPTEASLTIPLATDDGAVGGIQH